MGRSAGRVYESEKMSYSEFDISSADGTRLQGRAWTADNPIAVLSLIHGLGEHCGRYAHLAAFLNAQNISVYAVDLHGHGLTAGKRGLAEGVHTLRHDVDALLGFARLQTPRLAHFLMGHSMGGNIVLNYALENPNTDLRAIIAQAPLIKPADKVPAFAKTIVRGISKIAPDFAIKAKLDKEKISTLPAEQDAYFNDPLNHGYLGGKLALSLFQTGDAIAACAPDFPYDVLVTHGTQDRLTDYAAGKAFAAACPRADFISYPDSGHEIHNDLHRNKVYADLADWLVKRI